MKIPLLGFATATAICLSGCAIMPNFGPPDLSDSIAKLDDAAIHLPSSLTPYNAVLRGLCRILEQKGPSNFASSLKKGGVTFEFPDVGLPLRNISVPETDPVSDTTTGVPVVLEYETANATLYPPEGLFVDATAIYERQAGSPKLSLRRGDGSITMNGRQYDLAVDPTGASKQLTSKAGDLARSGFVNMIRPGALKMKSQVYLLDPYDPDKIPILMVHGLQSTPLAFTKLVEALRSDSETRHRYQIWQFYYPSGTPVLVNAAGLRDSLDAIVKAVDPKDRDAATKNIVVIGHSMGGLMSHTLVSSSGNQLWSSVFRVPPESLDGPAATISELKRVMFFSRNRRVSRVIFMATPHRGSPLPDSFIGILGNSLTRLSPMLERGFTEIANENPSAMKPPAGEFFKRGRFSSVRTLSHKSRPLVTLSHLEIEVPYYSIIGQNHRGPKESSSDGVVPYSSSHLVGAVSELVVRSGHGVIDKPDTFREVIRILKTPLPQSQ